MSLDPKVGDMYDNFGKTLVATRVSRDGRVVLAELGSDAFGKESLYNHREWSKWSMAHMRHIGSMKLKKGRR